MEKYNFEIFPVYEGQIKEDHYEFEVPIELFDGCKIHDKETGEFLGWVDAKNQRIVKYEVKEIIKEEIKSE